MIPVGRTFYKMSGSGNDFVMIDARKESRGALGESAAIQGICARGTGVGADGIVFLEPSQSADIRLTYLNADGSLADFCGNATLCTTRLSVELGAVDPSGFTIQTDSGIVRARIRDGLPEIDLPIAVDGSPDLSHKIPLEAGEQRIGYFLVGVPHLVILCDDVSTVDVVGRGRPLRSHPVLQDHGANVNFVSRGSDGRWKYRTYERGVEAETLACGSGAVATAILLAQWTPIPVPASVEIETRSGRMLRVGITFDKALPGFLPTLAGEGRVVYQGKLSEI
ncbi:MAG TPA: diaminopimelate epimerase [Gemmatimonadaceae bacterium]|jgi:diaminopimelate epimerase